jgi:hypothetical protein
MASISAVADGDEVRVTTDAKVIWVNGKRYEITKGGLR